ncbi:hypothetical protein [Marinobacter salicampi]|uniref:hypothetical protein n=1 Tax=Marinobacter salicampi TaxID=435907 RepID=UPI0014086C89|nr:hypothetical protein [Marinobacter salicampi]
MSWRERLINEPSLKAFSEWPAVDYNLIPLKKRPLFLRNQRLVSKVLSGTTLEAVAQSEGLSKGRVSQVLERCLGGNLDSPALLTEGLIPSVQVNPPQRTAPLPTFQSPGACTGAFAALLAQVPELKKELDRAIEADFKRKSVSERLTAESLHNRFVFKLAALNWPLDRYPYTTASRGYESVRRYWVIKKQELTAEQYQHQEASSQAAALPLTLRALATVQVDEHLIDVHSRISIELGGELIHLRLARCTLLLAIDVGTQCVLGFHLVPTAAPNQQDMLALIERCVTKRQPPALTTPQFTAPSGPAFPSELEPSVAISLGTVLLDNAWIHHSNSVVDFLSAKMGAALRFGYPALPKTRALVERVFHYLELRLGHRFDSTTGSSPTDPAKESKKNAKKPPMLSFQTLEEALYLTLFEFNHRPRPHLGGSSPMDLFRHQLQTQWIRYFAEGQTAGFRPWLSQKTVPVHRPKPGNGTPFVMFEYCRYRGPGLIKLTSLKSQVVIEYDRRDIRRIRAKTLKGEDLGELRAPQSWQRFAHSVSTRRMLFKNQRAHRADQHDPVTGWFSDLLEKRDQPKIASQILRIYQEISAAGRMGLAFGEDQTREECWQHNAATERSLTRNTTAEQQYSWSPIRTPLKRESEP